MVCHVPEDVVVDVTEELDFRLDAPVVLCGCEGWVAVEHAAVPTAHLVVAYFAGVLDVVFCEDFGRFFVEVLRDPRGHFPVLFWDDVVVCLGFGSGCGFALEFFGEGDVVEEGPGIIEFVVPCLFEFAHGGEEVFEFFVAD